MSSIRTSVVVIATGKYQQFLPRLIASIERHLEGFDTIYVLSDAPLPQGLDAIWLPWGHVAWPYPTLLRFRGITAYADELSAAGNLIYLDADMELVGDVSLGSLSGLLAVQHPGFVAAKPTELPYERRPQSLACIPLGEGLTYFAGGVQGGESGSYLRAAAEMSRRIQADLSKGIVPVWHDESVWNRYLIDNPPAAILSSDYCVPEESRSAGAKILALKKDHDKVRGIAARERWSRRAVSLRRRVRAHAVQCRRLLERRV